MTRQSNTVYAYTPNFVSVGLPNCRPLASKKLPFYRLRHFVVLPVGGDMRKLNTVAQLQTVPSSGIRIVSALQRLHGKIVPTNSTNKETDRQASKQKTQRFCPPSAAGEIRAPPNLAF